MSNAGGRTDRMLYAINDQMVIEQSKSLVVAVDERQRDYFIRAVADRAEGIVTENRVFSKDIGSIAYFYCMDEVTIDPRTGEVGKRGGGLFNKAPLDVKIFVDHRVLESLFGWALEENSRYAPREPGDRQETQMDGYVEGPKVETITKKTATCSQIGASLGLSFAKVSALAKRHGVDPAGNVVYDLGNGRTNEDLPARTFDLRGWEQIRDAALKEGIVRSDQHYEPPTQLRQNNE